jgi:quercetin dioxygenase-like cupin family protein
MGSALLSFENQAASSRLDRSILWHGGLITFHADSSDTAGQFALLEMEGGPGAEPPPHVHRNEDELFYVLEGKLKVLRGNEEITLESGQSAFLPRNVVHTFRVVSTHVRFLVYITPGGFENYFRDLGAPVGAARGAKNLEEPIAIAEMVRVAGRYSITFMP